MILLYILAGIGISFIIYIIYVIVFFAMMAHDITEEEAKELRGEDLE